MLIDFQVTNYRSFRNTTDFSMEKGKNVRKFKNSVLDFGNLQLLKTAVLFGANANGKTNLIHALGVLRFFVLNPMTNEFQKLPTDTFGYNNHNTKFKITFLKNDCVYDYLFEYNADEIVSEILRVSGVTLFEKVDTEIKVLPTQLLPLKDNIRRNQNLLFYAQLNNVEEAKIAYSWFLEDLIIVDTDQVPNILFKSLTKPEFKNKYLKFLRAADFNISDVEVKERKEIHPNIRIDFGDGETVIQNSAPTSYSTIYDVYSTHQSATHEFQIHFNNESTGTKAFMFLALYILHNDNSGKVLLIDEFDRSFHIELAEALLDVFTHDNQTNQFILTTHELSLMDYNLRQDQIWFTEKNEFGETELFSIYDFDDNALKRSDFGYKKRYLEGRYGASQIINKTILLEVVEELSGKE